MRNERNRHRRTLFSVFAGMDGVKALATFCLLVYAVVPPFIFCNCAGLCFAGSRIVTTGEESESFASQLNEPDESERRCGCCRCAEKRDFVAKPKAPRVKSRDVLSDSCCCHEKCDASETSCRDRESKKNCCERFFKKSANSSDDGSLTSIVKTVAWLSYFNVSTVGGDLIGALFYPTAEPPPPINRRLLFCVFLN